MTLDATLLELCTSLFPWAQYQQRKGAAKLHLVLDNDGYLPTFAVITDGKTADVTVARQLTFPKGSILVVDRGYCDYTLFQTGSNRASSSLPTSFVSPSISLLQLFLPTLLSQEHHSTDHLMQAFSDDRLGRSSSARVSSLTIQAFIIDHTCCCCHSLCEYGGNQSVRRHCGVSSALCG